MTYRAWFIIYVLALIVMSGFLLSSCSIDINGTHYHADDKPAPVVCKHQSPGVIKCRSE